MKQIALSEPEKEVCGFVYSDRFVSLTVQECSANMFVADPACVVRALALFGEPDAIFHTHPNGILNPSARDLKGWHYPRSILVIGTIDHSQLKYKAFRNASEGNLDIGL